MAMTIYLHKFGDFGIILSSSDGIDHVRDEKRRVVKFKTRREAIQYIKNRFNVKVNNVMTKKSNWEGVWDTI